MEEKNRRKYFWTSSITKRWQCDKYRRRRKHKKKKIEEMLTNVNLNNILFPKSNNFFSHIHIEIDVRYERSSFVILLKRSKSAWFPSSTSSDYGRNLPISSFFVPICFSIQKYFKSAVFCCFYFSLSLFITIRWTSSS